MSIEFVCTQCGKLLRTPDDAAGKQAQCPQCRAVMQVPPSSAAPADAVNVQVPPPPSSNPYESPLAYTNVMPEPGEPPRAKVMAPAIAMLLLAGLGLMMGTLGVIMAMFGDAPPINPDDPEFMQAFQRGRVGALAVVLQVTLSSLNLVIIAGAIQMLRFKSWGLALTAAIVSMCNVGNCCCLLGIPVGIWALVILLQQDVQRAFLATSDPANS